MNARQYQKIQIQIHPKTPRITNRQIGTPYRPLPHLANHEPSNAIQTGKTWDPQRVGCAPTSSSTSQRLARTTPTDAVRADRTRCERPIDECLNHARGDDVQRAMRTAMRRDDAEKHHAQMRDGATARAVCTRARCAPGGDPTTR